MHVPTICQHCGGRVCVQPPRLNCQCGINSPPNFPAGIINQRSPRHQARGALFIFGNLFAFLFGEGRRAPRRCRAAAAPYTVCDRG